MKQLFFALIVLLSGTLHAQLTDLQIAYNAKKKKDYEKAIEYYSKVIQKKSAANIYWTYYSRGTCYFELSKMTEAKADMKKAMKVKSDDEDYNQIMGQSLWLLASISRIEGKPEECLEYLKKTTQYIPSHELYSTIAYSEIGLGMYDSAVATLTFALTLDGNHAYAYSNRAWAYVKLGKLDEAMKDVEQSITLDPTNPYAFKHRALIYIEQKKMTEACADLNKSIDLGYRTFGQKDDPDAKVVDDLIAKYCK